MTASKYMHNLKAFILDDHFSQRRDRTTIMEMMEIWIMHKNEWRRNPLNEVDFDGFHYKISQDHDYRLQISCDKYTWVEDYSPVYITARFGS